MKCRAVNRLWAAIRSIIKRQSSECKIELAQVGGLVQQPVAQKQGDCTIIQRQGEVKQSGQLKRNLLTAITE